jgi:hypothetical protein
MMYPRPNAHFSPAATTAPPYSLCDPPADWPDHLKAVYMLAAAPWLTMQNLCGMRERDMPYDSLVEWRGWANRLKIQSIVLSRWIKSNEGRLLAHVPDVLTELNAVCSIVRTAGLELSRTITMLLGTAIDPEDRMLLLLASQTQFDPEGIANAKRLRDADQRRQIFLEHCTLEKNKEAEKPLQSLRVAISKVAWQGSMGWVADTLPKVDDGVDKSDDTLPSDKRIGGDAGLTIPPQVRRPATADRDEWIRTQPGTREQIAKRLREKIHSDGEVGGKAKDWKPIGANQIGQIRKVNPQ